MPINIAVTKKHSLEGLGEGWDSDCYILIKALSTAEVKQMKDVDLDPKDSDSLKAVTDLIEAKITGGRILNTKEDGSTELYDFKADEAGTVLDAMPPGLLIDLVETAVGVDPKALTMPTQSI